MIDFCILGTGISGSTIANLISKNYSVEVFDKARGPGGRASNKRYVSRLTFDHGVQYITPKSNDFKRFINSMKKNKVVKEWNGNHLDFLFKKDNNIDKKKYIGTKANNGICKYLLKNIRQNYFSEITKIKYEKNYWIITVNNKQYKYRNLILTCPYPQSIKLAKKYLNKKILNLKLKMIPNMTVMLAFKNQKHIPLSSIKFNDDIIAWAANENSKNRFKSKINLWTIQTTVNYSKKIIDKYKKKKIFYINQIFNRFSKLSGLKKNLIFKDIHGWKYAFSEKDLILDCYWDRKYNIGMCADWMQGSNVENAWNSANQLFKKIKKNPPKDRRV